MDRRRDIPALTGLRGIAALWVMLFHAFPKFSVFDSPIARGLDSGGFLGVDLFFVLSGFVLAYNYAGAIHSIHDYGSFLWKRLARIYPVHLTVLGALVLVVLAFRWAGSSFFGSPAATAIRPLIESIFLVHAWHDVTTFPWNGPSWTLSVEWAAYLMFPLAAAIRVRKPSSALLMMLMLYALPIICWKTGASHFLMTSTRLMAGFVTGVLILRVALPAKSADMGGLLLLAFLLFGSNFYFGFVGATYGIELFFSMVSAGVIYCFSVADGPVSRWLSSRPMQYLGRISFSLYMVHLPVMIGDDHLVSAYVRYALPIRLGAIAVALSLAHLMYFGVEEPCRRWMTGNLRRARDLADARRKSLSSDPAA